jgi:hypothetical protein
MIKAIRVTHALAVNILRSVLGIGLPWVVIRFGTLKNPIIREVLNIVYITIN